MACLGHASIQRPHPLHSSVVRTTGGRSFAIANPSLLRRYLWQRGAIRDATAHRRRPGLAPTKPWPAAVSGELRRRRLTSVISQEPSEFRPCNRAKIYEQDPRTWQRRLTGWFRTSAGVAAASNGRPRSWSEGRRPGWRTLFELVWLGSSDALRDTRRGDVSAPQGEPPPSWPWERQRQSAAQAHRMTQGQDDVVDNLAGSLGALDVVATRIACLPDAWAMREIWHRRFHRRRRNRVRRHIRGP